MRVTAAGLLLLAAVVVSAAQTASTLRPPAVPLVTHDPYFSVWSMSDRLADDRTKHWTGAPHGMVGMARIDGRAYRLMGQSNNPLPEPMRQTALEVTPTRTVYRFEAGGVALALTFMSPLLPEDLEVMSRPVTYLTWEARATDGRTHQVSLYFDCTAELAVNTADQRVTWGRARVGNLRALSVGTQQQPVLEKFGDDVRIDWGQLYLVVPPAPGGTEVIGWNQTVRRSFAETGALPDTDDLQRPRAAKDQLPALATASELGPVGERPVSRHLMLAYDDLFSVEYFNRRLRPYWRRDGAEAADLLKAAERDYASLKDRCEKFDAELMRDLRAAGGEEYARVGALAYRQTLAAHKLAADSDGTPLFFSKENFSNGCIGTVDVIYPSAPFFLLFSPHAGEGVARAGARLRGLGALEVSVRAARPRHLPAGQRAGLRRRRADRREPDAGRGERQHAPARGGAGAGRRQRRLRRRLLAPAPKWAEYLEEKGFDPENQLCTDDFAGHLAHNANLSAQGDPRARRLREARGRLGETAEASEYRREAMRMAARWVKMADDGDHYRLAFDKPGTWSQKYNLVWDRLLGLNLFPPAVARKEMAFYQTKQNKYGLPLDNREAYTKLDWIIWTATLAESGEDFKTFVAPVYHFLNESPSRVPLTDWYWTDDAKQAASRRARSSAASSSSCWPTRPLEEVGRPRRALRLTGKTFETFSPGVTAMRRYASLLATVLAVGMLVPIVAQQPPPSQPPPPDDDDEEVVRITTNLVQVDAVVTDGDGRHVTDLRPEEFEITEEGKRQEVTSFSYVGATAAERTAPAAAPPAEKGGPPAPPRGPAPRARGARSRSWWTTFRSRSITCTSSAAP